MPSSKRSAPIYMGAWAALTCSRTEGCKGKILRYCFYSAAGIFTDFLQCFTILPPSPGRRTHPNLVWVITLMWWDVSTNNPMQGSICCALSTFLQLSYVGNRSGSNWSALDHQLNALLIELSQCALHMWH